MQQKAQSRCDLSLRSKYANLNSLFSKSHVSLADDRCISKALETAVVKIVDLLSQPRPSEIVLLEKTEIHPSAEFS